MHVNDHQHQSAPIGNAPLDADVCRQARLARDPRFDGEFFLAVRTTGIYCRPICPARSPAEKNVTYYRNSVQAAQAGFRPCLRCRPESAPGSPAWQGSSTTVQRALALIQQGALNEDSLASLALRLGVGERYLRKLFQRELGTSPQAIALHQRLLFASKLLAETPMPITEVAFAAGFGSVRRFNDAVKAHFRLTPGALRRKRAGTTAADGVRLKLHYRPPYDWDGVINFFDRHAVAGVESIVDGGYERKLWLAGKPASLRVSSLPDHHALQLELHTPDHKLLMPLVARIRRMFDLDANPAVICATLHKDPVLAPLVDRFPGIRAPGSWSLFESSIRSIVGQQVSTVAARSICSRLAAACSDDPTHLSFPTAQALAALDDSHFPMPGRRRDTLRQLCTTFCNREEELDLAALAAMPGVGPWTVAMVAIRGGGDPDAFPPRDLGLEKAWEALPDDRGRPKNRLNDQTAQWRPWRAYAANLLWRSLSP
jgi:AraC family transcriptional regulator of adaptative response / DNA-3-methyladenine glycosylase II